MNNNNSGMCKNQLDLDVLCVGCTKARCIKAEQIIANDVCTQTAEVKSLSMESGVANNFCISGTLQSASTSSQSTYTNSLCATNATLTNACITNLTMGNLTPVINYRATVNYSTDTTYTLGSFLNFNNIVDDPNNNVTLSPNTTYTAPVSGYYTFSFKVNVTNLVSTSGPVLGVPVANPTIFVNGVLVREAYSPFITFFDTQKVIVDSLITLQAGDQVTMQYNVLGSNGTPITGTVNIVGTGIEDGNSFFKIILLSALGGGSQAPCAPCPVVSISCTPFKTPCSMIPASTNLPSPCSSC